MVDFFLKRISEKEMELSDVPPRWHDVVKSILENIQN